MSDNKATETNTTATSSTSSAALAATAAAAAGTLQLPPRYRWTAAKAVEGVDLHNKVAIVTGASSGIGVETTRALASAGAHVIMAVRDVKKAQAVIDDIKATTKSELVEAMELELSSLKSVNAFVEKFKQRQLPLHILINNAGIMATPESKTADGE